MSSEKKTSRRALGTIRLRLTLWSAGITLGVCLLLCGILYAGLAHSLEHEVDGFLEGEVHEMAALLEEHAHDYDAVEAAFRLELGQRPRRALGFRLLDEQGRVLVSSSPEGKTWHLEVPEVGQDDSNSRFRTIRTPKLEYPVRLCAEPFVGSDGRRYVAEAGYTLDRMSDSLAAFRAVCGVALVVCLLASIVGGRVMAQRSLGPIQSMTTKAGAINAQTLEQRIPLSGSGDELDRLAETLNGMLDRIERHVRRLRQFTADASHELRSPIAVLCGNAELALSNSRTAAELREVLADSIEQLTRLGRIAEDLLLLAKADADRLPFRRESVNLADAIGDVVDLYGPVAQERGIRLSADATGPASVIGDPVYLRQLIGNLVDNAVKYVGDGASIRVSSCNQDGLATIKVSDDGPGIAAEHLPHLFDRFYRVDRARSGTGPRGAGLGLPICRIIAEAHDGTITIEGGDLSGTTVTVCIPAMLGAERGELNAPA